MQREREIERERKEDRRKERNVILMWKKEGRKEERKMCDQVHISNLFYS